jgi:hypothetical protein
MFRRYWFILVPYIILWFLLDVLVMRIFPLWAYHGLYDKYPFLRIASRPFIFIVQWEGYTFFLGLIIIGIIIFALGQDKKK